ncbi:MAG: response regulator, partial [Candidatus Cyclobacteriaceae bacterium M2_1C_046]
SDLHMPGMSGFEFLEAMINDSDKNEIPVLIITSQPTENKRLKALRIGAADFIDKELLIKNNQLLKDRIELKLVTNVSYEKSTERLDFDRKKLSNLLMSEIIDGDFLSASRNLLAEIKDTFSINYISFWSITSSEPSLVLSLEDQQNRFHPPDYSGTMLKEELTYKNVLKQRKSYLSNNVIQDREEGHGILTKKSRDHGFPAEIGIPIFDVDQKTLLANSFRISKNANIFGYVILKRDTLFSDKEYKVLTKILLQSGTILWRLYSKI